RSPCTDRAAEDTDTRDSRRARLPAPAASRATRRRGAGHRDTSDGGTRGAWLRVATTFESEQSNSLAAKFGQVSDKRAGDQRRSSIYIATSGAFPFVTRARYMPFVLKLHAI